MSSNERIQSADDAARYLDGLIDRERMPDPARARSRFDLRPIQALLAAVGDPQRKLSVIHVAGSKGKGSLCLAAEPVLQALGERVGVFTSPHLERWTERFRIAGAEVRGAALAAVVERLRPHVELLRKGPPETTPSFFDATTAAALLLFADAGVDRVLLEVGLGGRLDSTNAVLPRVTCVTQIELEHTQILGETLAAIASEKAGILKPGVSCVMGPLAREAADVVRARAAELGAPLRCQGEDFEIDSEPAPRAGWTRLRYCERGERAGLALDLELPVVGRHLAAGAGLALACIRALDAHDDADFAAAASEGLRVLQLPGRVELAGREPRIVIDSAHTGASALALASSLGELGIRDAQLVLSVSRGKALGEILAALAPFASRMILTRADRDRSLSPDVLAKSVRETAPDVPVELVSDPRAAVRAAIETAGPAGAVVVAGSVYLAGVAREVVRGRGEPA